MKKSIDLISYIIKHAVLPVAIVMCNTVYAQVLAPGLAGEQSLQIPIGVGQTELNVPLTLNKVRSLSVVVTKPPPGATFRVVDPTGKDAGKVIFIEGSPHNRQFSDSRFIYTRDTDITDGIWTLEMRFPETQHLHTVDFQVDAPVPYRASLTIDPMARDPDQPLRQGEPDLRNVFWQGQYIFIEYQVEEDGTYIKGPNPVLEVRLPGGKTERIPLSDAGPSGAFPSPDAVNDVRANDGVYSTMIQLKEQGTYTLTVKSTISTPNGPVERITHHNLAVDKPALTLKGITPSLQYADSGCITGIQFAIELDVLARTVEIHSGVTLQAKNHKTVDTSGVLRNNTHRLEGRVTLEHLANLHELHLLNQNGPHAITLLRLTRVNPYGASLDIVKTQLGNTPAFTLDQLCPER